MWSTIDVTFLVLYYWAVFTTSLCTLLVVYVAWRTWQRLQSRRQESQHTQEPVPGPLPPAPPSAPVLLSPQQVLQAAMQAATIAADQDLVSPTLHVTYSGDTAQIRPLAGTQAGVMTGLGRADLTADLTIGAGSPHEQHEREIDEDAVALYARRQGRTGGAHGCQAHAMSAAELEARIQSQQRHVAEVTVAATEREALIRAQALGAGCTAEQAEEVVAQARKATYDPRRGADWDKLIHKDMFHFPVQDSAATERPVTGGPDRPTC